MISIKPIHLKDANEFIRLEKPHDVKMKEFYISVEIDEHGAFPYCDARKVKIHLCEECFKGLKQIGKNLKKRCE